MVDVVKWVDSTVRRRSAKEALDNDARRAQVVEAAVEAIEERGPGIGMAQVGLEGGVGKLGELEDRTLHDYTGGSIEHDYALDSRYAFIGLNARIKPPVLPVYFIGRAGYIGFKHDLEVTSTDAPLDTAVVTERSSFSRNDGGNYVGVGVGTTILPLLDVGLMVNQYHYSQVEYDAVEDEYELSDDSSSARSLTLTVEYRF